MVYNYIAEVLLSVFAQQSQSHLIVPIGNIVDVHPVPIAT
jgi:hypothetical protein